MKNNTIHNSHIGKTYKAPKYIKKEDFCPNCWGNQEYEHTSLSMTSVQCHKNNVQKPHFIQRFVQTYIDGNSKLSQCKHTVNKC